MPRFSVASKDRSQPWIRNTVKRYRCRIRHDNSVFHYVRFCQFWQCSPRCAPHYGLKTGDHVSEFKPTKSGCSSARKRTGIACQCDPGTIEFVYESYSGLVRRICRRMLRDPADAEDAAQDVFVCLLRKIHTFRGESIFSAWLYRLATNVALMRLRRNKSICAFRFGGIDPESVPAREFAGPYGALNGLPGRIDLQTAIDLLPNGYKTAVILHDFQGYAHPEIAEIFGYSVGNSKSQLHKAHKRLRKLLCGDESVRQNAKANSN